MNENESYVVKEYKADNLLIADTDFITNSCFKNFHTIHFHNFKHECIYEIKLTNVTDNELNSLTISGKSMNFFDLKKKSC